MKLFRRKPKPTEKLALNLSKGDIILGKKNEKMKIEVVVRKDQMRTIEVTVRTDDGKRHFKYDWREMVPMWKKPEDKRWRTKFIMWLAKKLGLKIKRV